MLLLETLSNTASIATFDSRFVQLTKSLIFQMFLVVLGPPRLNLLAFSAFWSRIIDHILKINLRNFK
jgi:tRNA(His) 5'-end guanylyltransferase